MAYVLLPSVAGFEGGALKEGFFLCVGRLVGYGRGRQLVECGTRRRGCMLPILLKVNYSVEKGVPAVKKC